MKPGVVSQRRFHPFPLLPSVTLCSPSAEVPGCARADRPAVTFVPVLTCVSALWKASCGSVHLNLTPLMKQMLVILTQQVATRNLPEEAQLRSGRLGLVFSTGAHAPLLPWFWPIDDEGAGGAKLPSSSAPGTALTPTAFRTPRSRGQQDGGPDGPVPGSSQPLGVLAGERPRAQRSPPPSPASPPFLGAQETAGERATPFPPGSRW